MAIGVLFSSEIGKLVVERLLRRGLILNVWGPLSPPMSSCLNTTLTRGKVSEEVLSERVSISLMSEEKCIEQIFNSSGISAMCRRTHILMTPVSPEFAQQLYMRMEAADANLVSAIPSFIRDERGIGKIRILTSGDVSLMKSLEPILLALGDDIVEVGDTPTAAHAQRSP